MQKMIASVSRDPDVEHLSIYFRDLNNGPWMGFNESEKFSPASLLKVPIMMAYLKKAENDLAFLKKEIIYKEDYQEKKFIGNVESGVRLIENEKYSIEELLKDMIVYSDNDSARILLENIDQSFLEKIYTDLTLPIPGKSKEVENFMTVKEYASFFRILYNASYLNREMSEKALEILSWSDFKDGLLAGVPNDIKVAHKFGERSLDNTVQLHDCGIIYNKEKPYLLCVMTRGKKFEKLKWVIRIVSEKVWEETQKQ